MGEKKNGGGRKKRMFIMVAALACLLIICIAKGDLEARRQRYGTVTITPDKPDEVSVGYRLAADLKAENDKEFGDRLYRGLAENWEEWNAKDRMEKALSSTIPGHCRYNTDTWAACEEVIGFAFDNPLESCDWLEIADYMGISLDTPVSIGERKHTEITWHGSSGEDIFEVHVTSGYRYGEMRVTLKITVDRDEEGLYETGSYWNENVIFEIEDYTMKNKNTAQLVTVLGAQRYTATHAYFVQDGMLYSMQVTGGLGQEKELRAAMERILNEFK